MEDLVRFGKCLADPSSVRVLSLLRDGELCICELMATLQGSSSKLNRILKKLRELQIIKVGRHGHWLVYKVHPRYTDLVETVFETFKDSADWDEQLTKDHNKLAELVSRRVDGWCAPLRQDLMVGT
ncbi:MAG TPA: metalloregulator ArsR/SmtB family transcription factor [Fimbriimonas sp.]|nr:metalloregulator ArsR/SmtB family transcription factor [Fimbriimonas sp.]